MHNFGGQHATITSSFDCIQKVVEQQNCQAMAGNGGGRRSLGLMPQQVPFLE